MEKLTELPYLGKYRERETKNVSMSAAENISCVKKIHLKRRKKIQ